jgi:hypothetical protein
MADNNVHSPTEEVQDVSPQQDDILLSDEPTKEELQA